MIRLCSIARAERDGTRAETRFRLSPKRTSTFKSVGTSVQSTAGSRGVRISLSNVGYTTFGGGLRVLATHSIRQFPLHFPSRASPRAITFQLDSTLPVCMFLTPTPKTLAQRSSTTTSQGCQRYNQHNNFALYSKRMDSHTVSEPSFSYQTCHITAAEGSGANSPKLLKRTLRIDPNPVL